MIEIDASMFLSILTLLIFGPVGWMIKSLITDMRRLDKKISEVELHTAETYVEKDDLHRELKEIKDMISRVFEKLDAK